jgi:hypothetical protein
MPKHIARWLTVLILPALLAACAPAASPTARVFFTSPADGASVASPVHVTLGAENFTVEPAGEVKAGAGHLHITVDADCVAAGTIIPKDEQHLHYGQAQLEADLELAPGAHTLCLQAADGAHTALPGDGLTQTIAITVK